MSQGTSQSGSSRRRSRLAPKKNPHQMASREEISAELKSWPDWVITEDCLILQAIRDLQELPINLEDRRKGRTPNWELAAEMVNTVSHTNRTDTMCRHRYTCMIQPREEGKMLSELAYYRNTSRIDSSLNYNFDNLSTERLTATSTKELLKMENQCFRRKLKDKKAEAILSIAENRTGPKRPLRFDLKPEIHTHYIIQSGINYHCPKTPQELAHPIDTPIQMVQLKPIEWEALYRAVRSKLNDSNNENLDRMLDEFEYVEQEMKTAETAKQMNTTKQNEPANRVTEFSTLEEEENLFGAGYWNSLPKLRTRGRISYLDLADAHPTWRKKAEEIIDKILEEDSINSH